MLKTPDGKPVTTLPHKEEYDAAMACLQPDEQTKLKNWLVKIIKENTYHNSYALGSKYLNDPEIQTLFLKSANGNKAEVGKRFGLFLYDAFMRLEDEWIVQVHSSQGRLDGSGYDYYKRKEDLQKAYLKT